MCDQGCVVFYIRPTILDSHGFRLNLHSGPRDRGEQPLTVYSQRDTWAISETEASFSLHSKPAYNDSRWYLEAARHKRSACRLQGFRPEE